MSRLPQMPPQQQVLYKKLQRIKRLLLLGRKDTTEKKIMPINVTDTVNVYDMSLIVLQCWKMFIANKT